MLGGVSHRPTYNSNLKSVICALPYTTVLVSHTGLAVHRSGRGLRLGGKCPGKFVQITRWPDLDRRNGTKGRGHQLGHHVDGDGEDDGAVVLSRDAVQGLQISHLGKEQDEQQWDSS